MGRWWSSSRSWPPRVAATRGPAPVGARAALEPRRRVAAARPAATAAAAAMPRRAPGERAGAPAEAPAAQPAWAAPHRVAGAATARQGEQPLAAAARRGAVARVPAAELAAQRVAVVRVPAAALAEQRVAVVRVPAAGLAARRDVVAPPVARAAAPGTGGAGGGTGGAGGGTGGAGGGHRRHGRRHLRRIARDPLRRRSRLRHRQPEQVRLGFRDRPLHHAPQWLHRQRRSRLRMRREDLFQRLRAREGSHPARPRRGLRHCELCVLRRGDHVLPGDDRRSRRQPAVVRLPGVAGGLR